MIYQKQSKTLNQTGKNNQVLPPTSSTPPPKPESPKQLKGLSLKVRGILIAIAVGVIPVSAVGAIAYKISEDYTTREITETQFDRTHHLAEMFDKFLKSRANEAQILASDQIFTNPNVSKAVTLNQKKAALNTFQAQTGFYDSIVYLDLQGKPLFESKSAHFFRNEQLIGDRQHLQYAIAAKRTTMNEPQLSRLSGELKIEFAVPVKDAWTDEVIGIIRFRIPQDKISPLFTEYVDKDEEWHLINTQESFLASKIEQFLNQPVASYYPQLLEPHATGQTATMIISNPLLENHEQLINYAPVKIGEINPKLNLGLFIAKDTDIAFAPLEQLKWTFLGGTLATALLVGAIAAYLVNRMTQPLLQFTNVVNRLGQGQLDTRITISKKDELALLGNNINYMAEQLQSSMQREQTIAKTSELMSKMSQSRSLRELQRPFNLFLAEVRNLIKADRVVFYQFDRQWLGTVIAESVEQGYPRTLGVEFDDPCFRENYIKKYQQGRIQAVADIYEANLTECHLQQLAPYEVRASLVLPVILEGQVTSEGEKLIGLLIAHQCSQTRIWEQPDVEYLQQIAYQLAAILRGYIFFKEENQQKVILQNNIAQLLNSLEGMANGDLTVSTVTEVGKMNSVGNFFNATVRNMRQRITQIKVPTQKINREITVSRDSLIQLKDELSQQINRLIVAFTFIDQMTNSIEEVSDKAGLALQTIDASATNVELERANFNSLIANISELQVVIQNTTSRIKDLKTVSQEMAQIISSVGQINLRTSLLANKLGNQDPELKDSALAKTNERESIQQSITGTKEIEKMVFTIESSIVEILRELETGAAKFVDNASLTTKTNKQFKNIAEITQGTQQLILSIINTTDLQIQTSQQINQFKSEITSSCQVAYQISDRAVTSLNTTALTAQDLHNAVDFFKLESIDD
jgi:methyl-accepting chemotaxis protein PixJ